MGNDTHFVEAEDLPFRLIEIPIGSAPPLPPSSPIRKSYASNKRHAPPIPPPRVQGYDAPPSLLPPPIPPKRFDEPIIRVPPRSDLHSSIVPKRFDQPIIQVPSRSDLPQSNSKNINLPYSSKKINQHCKRIHQPKVACCVIC